jgi:glycosyltransferase involved in cell wall biosynthesis
LTASLRLAVDARDLATDQRGIGTYARAVLARYAARDDIELTLLVRDWQPARALLTLCAAIGADARRVRAARRVPRDVDVVWHPWNGTFFDGRAPAVATIPDVVPFAFPATDRKRRASQQGPIRRSAATARAIVCDSQFTVGEVRRCLGVAADRLHRVALGVDRAFAPGPLDALPACLVGRRYLLYVGAHDAHKNVATLAEAYRSAFPDRTVALVFTRANPGVPEAEVIEHADLPTLIALYRGSALVAVPSIYEGFGLPLLEALACGAPVLASRAASLPEVGGDVAAYVDEPANAAAWASGLARLAGDDAARARMSARGPGWAAQFSWDRCADRTLEILRSTAFGVPANQRCALPRGRMNAVEDEERPA